MATKQQISDLAQKAASAVARLYVQHFIVDGDEFEFQVRYDTTGDIGFYWATPECDNDDNDPVFTTLELGDLDPENNLDDSDESLECLREYLYAHYTGDDQIIERLCAIIDSEKE